MAELYEINCPHCDRPYRLTRQKLLRYAGRATTCKTCEQAFILPALPDADRAEAETAEARSRGVPDGEFDDDLADEREGDEAQESAESAESADPSTAAVGPPGVFTTAAEAAPAPAATVLSTAEEIEAEEIAGRDNAADRAAEDFPVSPARPAPEPPPEVEAEIVEPPMPEPKPEPEPEPKVEAKPQPNPTPPAPPVETPAPRPRRRPVERPGDRPAERYAPPDYAAPAPRPAAPPPAATAPAPPVYILPPQTVEDLHAIRWWVGLYGSLGLILLALALGAVAYWTLTDAAPIRFPTRPTPPGAAFPVAPAVTIPAFPPTIPPDLPPDLTPPLPPPLPIPDPLLSGLTATRPTTTSRPASIPASRPVTPSTGPAS